MTNNRETEAWLVVYTRNRAEIKLMQDLASDGYHCYLPMYDKLRKWSDRFKKIRTPLLPGMLFVKTTAGSLSDIYKHPLSRFVLKEFGVPAVVRQEEIDNLDIIAREWDGQNIRACRADEYKPGDYVLVKRGNFKGLHGHLTEIKGRYRLLVQLSSANVAFSINLPASQVEKVAPKRELQVS